MTPEPGTYILTCSGCDGDRYGSDGTPCPACKATGVEVYCNVCHEIADYCICEREDLE